RARGAAAGLCVARRQSGPGRRQMGVQNRRGSEPPDAARDGRGAPAVGGAARRRSRAALETVAIIAYHQPVTRAEVEDIRGVAMSRGTLDQLLEIGWVRMRGRRRSPGRPVTYGTTDSFLVHFGLAAITDLPGLLELKGAGLLDANLPPDFDIPVP